MSDFMNNHICEIIDFISGGNINIKTTLFFKHEIGNLGQAQYQQPASASRQ